MRMLLIDDDIVANFLVAQICKINKTEIDFTYASSVAEAKEICENNIFDIILVDLNMPIESGWVFIDWFENQNKTTSQLYILSSSNHSKDLSKSQQFSCVHDYIEKPFGQKHLDEILIKNQSE